MAQLTGQRDSLQQESGALRELCEAAGGQLELLVTEKQAQLKGLRAELTTISPEEVTHGQGS